jgi:2-desacetyl-2-hydroxyethyl bacteriochlorophyllide A dehydrogenase
MKAVVCNKPFDLEVTERPEPTRASGDVLVRIHRVGLCGTDYHIYDGNQPFLSYPRVMGHELAGEVIENSPTSSLKVGQLVTINPYLACGTCHACRRGKPNCCSNIAVLGVHTDGGMVERLAVPESAIVDAAGLTVDQAAMVEFLAIGAHAVARARLSAEDRVLIVGAGPIGIAAGLFARLDGAKVTLVDTRQSRLDRAQGSLGFADVVLAGPDTVDALAKVTNGAMFDCVFDATGNIDAMRAGLAYVAHGGSYVLVGVVKDDLVFPDPEFHKREATLIASRNALAHDFARVIDAIRSGTIPTDALHTHAVSVDDLPNQMPQLIADADNVMKAIVRF